MAALIYTLRHDWHPMRLIYLVLGFAFLWQAVQTRDWTFGLVGALFLYQSLWNAGCCGAGRSLMADSVKPDRRSLEDTDYTEIK